MNKDMLNVVKRAASVALIGLVISLSFCTALLGSNIFEKLVPLAAAIVFAALYIALRRINALKAKAWVFVALTAVLVAACGVCLHFFC